MKEYQPILNKFSNGAFSIITRKEYSTIPPEVYEYLAKYWLHKSEFEKNWLPIKNSIFKGDFKSFPHVFKDEFETIFEIGGSVINTPDYYNRMQVCMNASGDQHFVFVQDLEKPVDLPPGTYTIDWPRASFKYPVKISYEKILSGEFLTDERMQMGDINYFVYGDSGNWGIYAGDDLFFPLHIIGFKKEFSELFRSQFPVPTADIDTVKEWIEKNISHIEEVKKRHPEIL
jgi:hypothetical protein